MDLHLTAYGGRDDGLFHAAAAESQSFATQLTVEQSQYQYDALVERAGCQAANDTLKCLRDLSVAELQAVNTQIPFPNGTMTPLFMYSNVVDYDFTPDFTYNLFAQGKFVHVPVIFGHVTYILLKEYGADEDTEMTLTKARYSLQGAHLLTMI